MGYYSSFELSVVRSSESKDIPEFSWWDFETIFNGITDYRMIGNRLENVKWYRHKEDMLVISKMYPDYVFELTRTGEEEGDIVRYYHHNGMMQTATAAISFAAFDKNKLE